MTKQTEQKATPADPVSTALSAVEDAGLGSLAWMGSAWMEAMSDIGSDALSFMADRVREDVKTQHELLHCKSLLEIQQVQSRFLEKAYAQYAAETGKIIERSTGLLSGPLEKHKAMPI